MGIHLNTRNPKEPHDYSGHISCTCHSLDEVQNKKHFYDYLFLSPIYNCITKSGVTSGFTAEELRQAGKSKIIDSKVMALGGITPDNILEIKNYGFGGAVVMGDLWNKFNACTDRDYLEVIHHFKKIEENGRLSLRLANQNLSYSLYSILAGNVIYLPHSVPQ